MKTLTMALCLSIFAVTASAQQENVVTTVGEGEVSVVPDMAHVSMGVTARNAEAAVALDETSRALAAVISRLEAAGIASGDIQTGNLSLYPIRSPRTGETSTEPEITGYEASNTLTVAIFDLDRLGGVLDDVVSEGANTLNGLSFSLADPSGPMAEARRRAVRDAITRAEQLTQAAEVDLGPILSISEQGHGGIGPKMEMSAARMADVPVAPGSLTVSAQVTMTFAIGQ